MPADDRARREQRRTEAWSAVLLALAMILTAWSTYQATRWTGVAAIAFSGANASRAESVRLSTQAGQSAVVDVQSFLAWLAAVRDGDASGAAIIRTRFRPEFATAFDAWLGSPPGTAIAVVDIPSGTPFERADYRPAAVQQAEQRARAADASFEIAGQANQSADNHVLVNVLLAFALFLAGTAPRFEVRRIQIAMLTVSGTLALVGLAAVAILPTSIGI